jgi:hypothetical protein
MQWHIHKGKGGPVLVQFSLSNSTQLELWVNPSSIAEGEQTTLCLPCSPFSDLWPTHVI